MNQRIGYARVSTDDQNLDLQRDALRLAGVGSIYEEAASGKTATRQELDHCLKALQAGDTLVVWRLDRLGRSLPDLVQIVAGLEEKGIGFESITEKIETTSAAGKLALRIPASRAATARVANEREDSASCAARALRVARCRSSSKRAIPSRAASRSNSCALSGLSCPSMKPPSGSGSAAIPCLDCAGGCRRCDKGTAENPCTALMRHRSSAMHRRSKRGAHRSARDGVGCRAEPDQDVVVQRPCASRVAVRTTLILYRNDYAANG